MATEIPTRIAERLRAVAAETLRSGQVNLSAVAAATGVPRSTLYYNFKGSEELTQWFVEQLLIDLGEQVAAAVALEEDPRAQLEAAIHLTMAVTTGQPELTAALLRSVFAGPEFAERLQFTRATVFSTVREVLQRGIATERFVDVDVDETIAAFIGAIAVISLHHLGTLGPADPQPPTNDFLSLMLRSLVRPGDALSVSGSGPGQHLRS